LFHSFSKCHDFADIIDKDFLVTNIFSEISFCIYDENVVKVFDERTDITSETDILDLLGDEDAIKQLIKLLLLFELNSLFYSMSRCAVWLI
jgi:hypothetical protein